MANTGKRRSIGVSPISLAMLRVFHSSIEAKLPGLRQAIEDEDLLWAGGGIIRNPQGEKVGQINIGYDSSKGLKNSPPEISVRLTIGNILKIIPGYVIVQNLPMSMTSTIFEDSGRNPQEVLERIWHAPFALEIIKWQYDDSEDSWVGFMDSQSYEPEKMTMKIFFSRIDPTGK